MNHLIFWIAGALAELANPTTYTRADVLEALRIVECGDVAKPPRGDGGAARGWYQIWRVYWYDAVEFSGLGGTYEQVETDRAYADQVVSAYMDRYAKEAWSRILAGTASIADVEKVARIHNGGPRGHKKKATDRYWSKVKKELKHAKN